MPNRLAGETSPYLLQHADNPVDWYPWGDEALSRARSEQKPILLSVGYAACHWCHVMEHESFEDAETARLMNENFVCVKVDREERPDIDAVYMDAVQSLTGHGGWPMTVFLTPDGAPFYGGTYFPPDDRHGLPSFRKVLAAVADAWRDRREEAEAQGAALIEHVAAQTAIDDRGRGVTRDMVETARARLQSLFDPVYGGFGGAPKFPQPMTIDFLLRLSAGGDTAATEMAVLTLDRMSAGGMFDQLAGGFARYSVDGQWMVPHFEKMLYDNAQLLRTYARAWQVTESPRFAEVAEMTAEWMLAELRDPSGGFYSSLDADSEGEEGKFYVWTLDEIRDACGGDFDVAVARWGFTAEGNFEGRNIPVLAGAATDPEAEARARAALLEHRGRRVAPATDTKVLAGWNGLAAAGLAEAGAALGRDDWVRAASECAGFILSSLRVDGRLMRSYHPARGSEIPSVRHLGYCEDYAYLLEASLALFEATHRAEWLDHAVWAADEAIRLFAGDDGIFYTSGSDAPSLVVRPRDYFDNALPSANSVMALEFQRLALLTGIDDYRRRAEEVLTRLAPHAARAPQGFGHLLSAVDFYTGSPVEVVLVGEMSDPEMTAMLDLIRRSYRPNQVLVVTGDADALSARIPLLEGRGNGEVPTAYVCRNMVCELPVTSARELGMQLARTGGVT